MSAEETNPLAQATPRINGSMVSKFEGKRVRLVGKITSLCEGGFKLKTSDEEEVMVHSEDEANENQFVEMVCDIAEDSTINALWIGILGGTFDLPLYNEAVILCSKNPKFFPVA